MATVSDLFDIAAAFLAASITALEKTTAGPPDRAYVAPGDPALDCCDQLTVHNQFLGEVAFEAGSGAMARAKAINRGGLATATVVIEITRCVAVGTVSAGKISPPKAVELQQSARTIDEDGWALWLGLNYSLKHGDLAQFCSGAERLGGTKLIPQGGCGGWVFSYRYPIEGGILA